MNQIPNINHHHHSNSLTPTSNQNFDELQRIIEESVAAVSNSNNKNDVFSSHNVLEIGLACIAKKQSQKFVEIAKEFSTALLENRYVYLHYQYLIENFNQLKLMVCKHNKIYQLSKQPNAEMKGFVVIGKAISIHKRKKKQQQQFEHKEEKEEIVQLIEQGIIRLHEDGKYILQKQEKAFKIQDILMQHDMPDASVDEVYLGNQVHLNFVPVEKSIILVIPSKLLKPQCFSFIKSSLLHSYIDQANLISKIITKQQFYKNSILKGLYFIDEGEVEVKSGRIIARGWTTYGKCKTSGFGWKFKPIPFIRFIVKNSAIWKQFYNDITANSEYPFNIIHILSLSDNQDFTSSAQWKSLGRKRIGGKSPKLPRLNISGAKSVDDYKFEQIQKLRHYDDRINNIFTFKQDLLTRKLKGIVHGKFEPIVKDQRSQQKLQKKKKQIMMRLNSKASVLQRQRKQPPFDTQPGQNILIMSVLKRLQSIADMNQTVSRRQYSISHGVRDKQQISMMVNGHTKSKRDNVKILPMQLHQKSKQLKRSRRY